MNEQRSQNLLLKVDPLSTVRSNRLITQGERLETSAKLRVFVSNISSPSLKQRYTWNGLLFLDRISLPLEHSATYSYFCSARYALISGHPGGGELTPGTYGGIPRDLLTFVANFWPATRALNPFCTSEQDTRGKTREIWNITAILKMKDLDRGDWILPFNGFQNGVGEKGKRVLRFRRKFVPFCWSTFPNIAKIFFARYLWSVLC